MPLKKAKTRRRLSGLASAMDDRESVVLPEDRASLDWLTATFLLGPLAILAELLITKTHHRPLGAATFASFAVFAWLVGGLVVRGLVRIGGTVEVDAKTRTKGLQSTSADANETAEQKSRVLPWLWLIAVLSSLAVFVRVLF